MSRNTRITGYIVYYNQPSYNCNIVEFCSSGYHLKFVTRKQLIKIITVQMRYILRTKKI